MYECFFTHTTFLGWSRKAILVTAAARKRKTAATSTETVKEKALDRAGRSEVDVLSCFAAGGDWRTFSGRSTFSAAFSLPSSDSADNSLGGVSGNDSPS